MPEITDTIVDQQTEVSEKDRLLWFVLRDLKRPNAKLPGYKILGESGFEVFTPMKWVISNVGNKRRRLHVPVLSDLVFVHSTQNRLRPVLDKTPTLQYRYVRGAYCKPMVVNEKDMARFIVATQASDRPVYYTPDELDKLSIGKSVTIMGGPLAGIEGKIVNVRGARKKRVMVELPGFIAAVVEVESEFLQINTSTN